MTGRETGRKTAKQRGRQAEAGKQAKKQAGRKRGSKTANNDKILVVAIDFGTTYSGYAFSFVHDFKSKPLNVETMNVTTPYGQMAKVPTSVLFDPQQQFHSFGVEAEEEYARMSQDDAKKAKEWFYFERFKMTLHKNPSLTRDMELLDQTQKKSMLAIDVFSAAISHLKKDFSKELQKKKTGVRDNDITWVLTIPAIWEDQARQFMREAAEKAGIPRKQLVFALEPEAASVYCLAFCKANQSLMKPFTVGKGAKFMLVDCGGGTIDISILEITATGNLRHLHKPAGTADGGISVDSAFKSFLVDLVGFDGVTSFEALETLHLRRSLEETKRSFKATDEKAHIQIPTTVKTTLSVKIGSSEKYINRVSILKNRLSLDGDLFLSFYNQATAGITAAIRDALGTNKVDAIFLAGGFSESDVIQNAVQQAFPEMQVVTAQTVSQSVAGCQSFSPVGAVLMGAVMYGHDPQVIATRISAYTYGIAYAPPFVENVHDESRAVTYDDGIKRCANCFHIHILNGQKLEVNTLLPYKIYCPTYRNMTTLTLEIYKSSKKDLTYVDEEGVEKIGSVTVLIPDTTGGTNREIQAAMMVGGTELKLVARNPVTQKEFTTTCEFLFRN